MAGTAVRRMSDAVLFPCTARVNGAAGHNRGEVAETPPLAKTQSRTVDCSFDVCRVRFKSHLELRRV